MSNHTIDFKGRRLAEKLELFLFICPKCKSLSSLKSKGTILYCKICNLQAQYDLKGNITSNSSLSFTTPSDWNIWQIKYFKKNILNLIDSNILNTTDTILLKGNKMSKLNIIDYGTLFIDEYKLYLQSNEYLYDFNLKDIEGVNIQYNKEIDFYLDNVIYRIKFKNSDESAYKWQWAIKILKEYNNLLEV